MHKQPHSRCAVCADSNMRTFRRMVWFARCRWNIGKFQLQVDEIAFQFGSSSDTWILQSIPFAFHSPSIESDFRVVNCSSFKHNFAVWIRPWNFKLLMRIKVLMWKIKVGESHRIFHSFMISLTTGRMINSPMCDAVHCVPFAGGAVSLCQILSQAWTKVN